MLNRYILNIQESLKHAWHWGIGFLRCLAAKVLKEIICFQSERILSFKSKKFLMVRKLTFTTSGDLT